MKNTRFLQLMVKNRFGKQFSEMNESEKAECKLYLKRIKAKYILNK